jgi:hypothetical protein
MNNHRTARTLPVLVLALALACSLPAALGSSAPDAPAISVPTALQNVAPVETVTAAPIATNTATVAHVSIPSNQIGTGKLTYDVVSEDTAPEKRAPYGDSYDINRLERPFLQDMTYLPDLDIYTFTVSSDDTWWYVSIALVGSNPNNEIGINYGVELDLDHDGFGEYLILARPPYTDQWQTSQVQIYEDLNHDTGGRSAEKSDAPLTTDGYEKVIFSGGAGDPDPDLAWARSVASADTLVQFAFKKSWSGTVFMLGPIADAGLKDAAKLDYVDRYTAADAGSPVRDNKNYPLKALYAVDNVCRAPFGFKATGYEPQLCPTTEPPATKRPRNTAEPDLATNEAPPPEVICLPAGTLIDTPQGTVTIESLRVGDAVWSASESGVKFPASVARVARVPVPPSHMVAHIFLADGREVWASPGHPTADGRTFDQLRIGDQLDGSLVTLAETLPSGVSATYDILPAGPTGYYWANGVLVGSTLK